VIIEAPRERQAHRQREGSSQRRLERAVDEDSAESADEYQDERDDARKKKPARRRRDDADGDRQPKQRKRKRAAPPPENLDDLPPEVGMLSGTSCLYSPLLMLRTARRRDLDNRIDAIIKPKKGSRKPKKKKGEDDVLDHAADEEVSRLREAMLGAADDDEQANRDKIPAVAKLRLLPQVMEVLRKYASTYLALEIVG
jgi:transcription factor SPN1